MKVDGIKIKRMVKVFIHVNNILLLVYSKMIKLMDKLLLHPITIIIIDIILDIIIDNIVNNIINYNIMV